MFVHKDFIILVSLPFLYSFSDSVIYLTSLRTRTTSSRLFNVLAYPIIGKSIAFIIIYILYVSDKDKLL